MSEKRRNEQNGKVSVRKEQVARKMGELVAIVHERCSSEREIYEHEEGDSEQQRYGSNKDGGVEIVILRVDSWQEES